MGDPAGERTERFQLLRAELDGLGLLERGDVLIHFQNSNRFSLRIPMQDPFAGDGNAAAVVPTVDEFTFPAAAREQGLFNLRERRRKFGSQQVMTPAAQSLLLRVAVELFGAAGPQNDAAIHVPGKNGSQAQKRRLLAQLFLRLDALGNIPQDHREHFLSRDGHVGDRRLDGEFLPVGAQSVNRTHFRHFPAGHMSFSEIANVLRMRATESLGQKPFQ